MHGILDEALVCTVSFVDGTDPVTIPTNFVRIGDDIIVHGKSNAAYLRALTGGGRVCLSFTLIDGLVLARSAFHHSMNYRSVVMFGIGEAVMWVLCIRGAPRSATLWKAISMPSTSRVTKRLLWVIALPCSDANEKTAVLRTLAEKYTPGRSDHVKPPSASELTSTAVVRIPIVEVSAKVRSGPPKDDAEDYDSDAYWAGVIPLQLYSLPPVPDDKLKRGVSMPMHVRDYCVVPALPKPPRTSWVVAAVTHAVAAAVAISVYQWML